MLAIPPRKWAGGIHRELEQQSLETFSECDWVTVMDGLERMLMAKNESREVDPPRLVLKTAIAWGLFGVRLGHRDGWTGNEEDGEKRSRG